MAEEVVYQWTNVGWHETLAVRDDGKVVWTSIYLDDEATPPKPLHLEVKLEQAKLLWPERIRDIEGTAARIRDPESKKVWS